MGCPCIFVNERAGMKSIYILLTKSETTISKIIRLTTSDLFTHASISFEQSLQPLYSFSRKRIHIPLPAGLRVEPLNTGFYKKYEHIPCALYELQVEDEVYHNAKQEVEQMLLEAKQYHFSVLGLLLCRLNIPMNRKKRYFCSQFVSEILHRSNAIELPKPTSLMRPADYIGLPGLSCLFLGELRTLNEQHLCAAVT